MEESVKAAVGFTEAYQEVLGIGKTDPAMYSHVHEYRRHMYSPKHL